MSAYVLTDMLGRKSGTWADAAILPSVFPVGTRVEHEGDRWHGRRSGTVVEESNTYGQQVIFDDLSETRLSVTHAGGLKEWEQLDETPYTAEQIADLKTRRQAMLAEQEQARQVESQRKTEETRLTAEELRKHYSWAKGADGKISDHARAAYNLKQELKREFPGVKFSVHSDSFSMGNSIDVKWTDGPTTKEVDAFAKKYQEGSFNGMEDIYEYNDTSHSAAVAQVLGQAKYVSTSRHLSARYLRDVTLEMCFEYGHDDLPVVKDSGYNAYLEGGHVPYCSGARETLHDKILQTAYERSLFVRAEPKQVKAVLPVEGVTVTENDERDGLEVRFSSKPSDETLASLKANGWRWSRFNKCWYHKRTDAARTFAESLA